MFDIIGDIHGCADQLQELLAHLGYVKQQGEYRHPERQAIFLGDFVDRGPEQQRTLDLVRPMIDSGRALSVLGNHEFNAISYATRVGSEFARPHTKKNHQQHEAFLREFPLGSTRHDDAIAWFRTLPLFIDLPGMGIVHACWCERSFAVLDPVLAPGCRVSDLAIDLHAQQGGPVYEAIERILKGPEHPLPPALWFKDKDGHTRSSARLKWWKSQDEPMSERLEFGGTTLSAAELSMVDEIEPAAAFPLPSKPVFVGHYWQRGEPQPLSATVACVDYSVAKNGVLAAYRWDGEEAISPAGFAWVKSRDH